MSMLPFFDWCEASALGTAIRNSVWLFPVIEAVHLLGLASVGAVVLVVDMRALGFGLRDQPADKLSAVLRPWLIGSLAVMLGTGALLFVSEPTKLYYNQPFWLKMGFLATAIVYTFSVRQRVLSSSRFRGARVWQGIAALCSLGLWLSVGICGRWIGFY
jgi:hypothetical protein